MGAADVRDQVSRAWQLRRTKDFAAAAKAFESLLQTSPDDIDANYGMGIVQKDMGKNALPFFQRAQQLVEMLDFDNAPQTERDRQTMLKRMISQRIKEVG